MDYDHRKSELPDFDSQFRMKDIWLNSNLTCTEWHLWNDNVNLFSNLKNRKSISVYLIEYLISSIF